MPSTRKSVPGEKIAEAKHLYERTLVPTDDIAAMLGISRWTLQRRAKVWGWKVRTARSLDRKRLSRGMGRRVKVVRQVSTRKDADVAPPSLPEGVALIERVQAVAEREIAAVEQILKTLGETDPIEMEGAARTLASLARTLRELVQLDVPPASTEPTHDEPIPRDLGELRRSLARKLAALVAGDAGSLPGQS